MRVRTIYRRHAVAYRATPLMVSILGAAIALLAGSCDQYPTDLAGLEPPSVTGFLVTPDSANVTGTDVEVMVSLGARGMGGVDSAAVTLAGPGEADLFSCVARQPAAGDRISGDWECAFTLAIGSAPGLWRVSRVDLHHSGGELLRLLSEDLLAAGFNTGVEVVLDVRPAAEIDHILIEPHQAGLLEQGDTVRFRARAFDSDGFVITGQIFDWTISNSVVANMEAGDFDALVTANVPGTTFVRAAIDDVSAVAQVVVGAPGVWATPPMPSGMEAGFLYGSEIRFEGGGVSQTGLELTGAALVWSSDFDGEFGTGEVLTTSTLSAGLHLITLTATDDFGLSASDGFEIMIMPAQGPDTVVITPQAHTFQEVGETFQFQARAYYQGTTQEIPGARIRWLSADPNIVEIDAAGRATARGEGTTEIGAFINTGLDVIEVTVGAGEPVEPPVDIGWVVVDPWVSTISELGGTAALTATAYGPGEDILPEIEFTWTSLDPTIATVNQQGLVTAVGYGTARIQAEAWGVSGEGTVYTLDIGPPIQWDTVAAGSDHSCGLAAGVAYCWGENRWGGLGTGDTDFRMVPTRVAGDHRFRAISVGEGYTVALTDMGLIYAWGQNSYGQLGDGTTTDRYLPTWVPTGSLDFAAISAGGSHVLALTRTYGELYAWGNNSHGQFGNGTMQSSSTPVPVPGIPGATHFDAVSAGAMHSLALSDGIVLAWGRNHWGQVGDQTTSSRTTPVPLGIPEAVVSVSAGGYHSTALTASGKAYAWGYGLYGQIGVGTNQNYNTSPVEIAGGHTFASLSAGGESTMGITTAGVAYAWGLNWYGKLGIGNEDGGYNRPTPIFGGIPFVSISVGGLHTLGLTAAGTAYGWGGNDRGAVGDGTLTTRLVPTAVVGPSR
jgi:alpha-tubulin suppressor-like RCC1 family protein